MVAMGLDVQPLSSSCTLNLQWLFHHQSLVPGYT